MRRRRRIITKPRGGVNALLQIFTFSSSRAFPGGPRSGPWGRVRSPRRARRRDGSPRSGRPWRVRPPRARRPRPAGTRRSPRKRAARAVGVLRHDAGRVEKRWRSLLPEAGQGRSPHIEVPAHGRRPGGHHRESSRAAASNRRRSIPSRRPRRAVASGRFGVSVGERKHALLGRSVASTSRRRSPLLAIITGRGRPSGDSTVRARRRRRRQTRRCRSMPILTASISTSAQKRVDLFTHEAEVHRKDARDGAGVLVSAVTTPQANAPQAHHLHVGEHAGAARGSTPRWSRRSGFARLIDAFHKVSRRFHDAGGGAQCSSASARTAGGLLVCGGSAVSGQRARRGAGTSLTRTMARRRCRLDDRLEVVDPRAHDDAGLRPWRAR